MRRTVVCLVRPHVSPASLPSAQKAGPIFTTSPPQHTHSSHGSLRKIRLPSRCAPASCRSAHTHTIPAIPPLMISRLLFLVFCFHQICGHHFGADKPDIILLSTRSTEAAGVSSGDGDRRNVIRPPQTAFLDAACTLQSCARRSRCEAEKIKVISNFNK